MLTTQSLHPNFTQGLDAADRKKPPMTWHKVKISGGSRRFTYRDRDGNLLVAERGSIVEIDRDALHAARRCNDIEKEF